MDTREAARFLGRLYDEGHEFELAFIHPDMTRSPRVARVTRTFTEGTVEQVLAEMERGEASGFNVYVSALPRHLQEARTFDRIWVDQDDPAAPWPFGSDESFKAPTWPKPSTLVKTSEAEGGMRYQAIWRLSGQLEEDEARETMKRLAAQVGADASVHDPRRVLRVPGIMNAKRNQYARLIDTEAGTVSIQAFNLPKESAVEALLSMKVNNPSHVLGEWLRGTTEGDRSRKAYVAARFLKSCDVDWADAAGILKLGASRCSPAMDDRELEHCLNSAYHRGKK